MVKYAVIFDMDGVIVVANPFTGYGIRSYISV